MQRRRRGLYRFLNQLIKHPVLREEPVVITFLSVPTDISTWKKQAKIDYSIEFKGVKILSEFINRIWPTIGKEFLESWSKAEAAITILIETWTRIVLLVERYEKRQQQIRYDNTKFEEVLGAFRELDVSLYPTSDTILGDNNRNDVDAINASLGQVSEFYSKSSQLIIDESYAINTQVLEKLKNYLDYLYSMQELFERTKRLSVNNIESLERKIAQSQARLNKLSEEPDAKANELAKLRQVIFNDKQEIFRQLNNDWLIKQACLEEFLMFQETQYLVGEMWVEWSKGRTRFQEKLYGLHEDLSGSVGSDMPVGR